ncbi:unnamed protein product [Vitrella brassicaformis CCMP3155]|uniref:RING-type domain-containing protein n=2 Tax=Vitrella brassicaformis TaxID=1169539 RepID=A0A0G4GPQ4_VITBC|nr:unnamed protein product [Vitrella brassicaformis CCMP3155]|eukprot:CEM32337.1 unnamed protein product [Vitrella brassicaformis CCMP3155]
MNGLMLAPYPLPQRYTIPKDVCGICRCSLALTSDLARLKCGHLHCWQCVKGLPGCADADSSADKGMEDYGPLSCPTCHKGSELVERIRKPSASLVPDVCGGPFRDVTVTEAEGTVAVWKASYYLPFCVNQEVVVGWGDLNFVNWKLETAHIVAKLTRDTLAVTCKRLAASHKTADAIFEALRWDAEAEAFRAGLRVKDALASACQDQIRRLAGRKHKKRSGASFGEGSCVWVCGVVGRPEYNGLEGKVTAILPPNTPDNKSDVTRYHVCLSLCGQLVSLRADNLRGSDTPMTDAKLMAHCFRTMSLGKK